MDYLIVGLVAFLASGPTLYSGFGLGTVLLPAFTIFFPVPVGRGGGDRPPPQQSVQGQAAAPASRLAHGRPFRASRHSCGGPRAWLLVELGDTPRLFAWEAFGRTFGPRAAGVPIGTLMIPFALLELQPWFSGSSPRRACCRWAGR